MTPTILQIFKDMDLRAGEYKLAKEFTVQTGFTRQDFRVGEVVVFINRKRNKLRVVAKTGMMVESLPAGQTYDLTLRRTELLKSVGKFFGLEFSIRKSAYGQLQEVIEKEAK